MTSRVPGWAWFAGSAIVGSLAAVVIVDVASEEPETTPAVNAEDVPNETVRPVPVLSPDAGEGLARAVALVSIGTPDGEVIGSLLGSWGAVFADGVDDEVPEGDGAVDDTRLFGAEVGPVFTDPCIDEPDGDGCPDPAEVIPAVVEGDPPLGPNAAVVHVFPRPDAELAAECRFSDLAPDELPIAVVTANPGTLTMTVGPQLVNVASPDEEVEEFEAWRATGELPRPPDSFVAHCVAVPRPTAPGPVLVRAVAVDDAAQTATAEATVLPSAPGQAGPTITPIDGTMVRVDVPLPETGDADVFAPPPDSTCSAPAGDPVGGWRLGSTSLVEAAPTGASAPYLESSPRVRRVTVPLAEGQPNLVCIVPDGIEAAPASLLVTPPDARRLTLAVTEVDAPDGIGDEELVVLGTFTAAAWTPCATVLGDVGSGILEPGLDGLLCTSGGDTGAIAAAGGVLDVAVEVGDSVHVARIVLSATPGGAPADVYRLPIPAPGLEGVLCTDGVDQPGCTPPEGDAVLGTVEVTATWDEGPVGPPAWSVVALG